jgi:hypothetical protein
MDFDPCLCCGRMEISIDFFYIQQVLEGSNVDNLTKVIVDSVLTYGGLWEFDLASKLVCFGIDGVMTLQGWKFGVTVQLKEKHTQVLC